MAALIDPILSGWRVSPGDGNVQSADMLQAVRSGIDPHDARMRCRLKKPFEGGKPCPERPEHGEHSDHLKLVKTKAQSALELSKIQDVGRPRAKTAMDRVQWARKLRNRFRKP
ncbi:MAG: hypothetical protein Tsb0024_12170 [Ruegeria sp.]